MPQHIVGMKIRILDNTLKFEVVLHWATTQTFVSLWSTQKAICSIRKRRPNKNKNSLQPNVLSRSNLTTQAKPIGTSWPTPPWPCCITCDSDCCRICELHLNRHASWFMHASILFYTTLASWSITGKNEKGTFIIIDTSSVLISLRHFLF